jgi:hypothetical protein
MLTNLLAGIVPIVFGPGSAAAAATQPWPADATPAVPTTIIEPAITTAGIFLIVLGVAVLVIVIGCLVYNYNVHVLDSSRSLAVAEIREKYRLFCPVCGGFMNLREADALPSRAKPVRQIRDERAREREQAEARERPCGGDDQPDPEPHGDSEDDHPDEVPL